MVNPAYDEEVDIQKEYESLKNRMVNVIGQVDVRMPADYIHLAFKESLERWCLYTEGAYPNY